MQRRTLALVSVMIPVLGLFMYVALRSGPLAPVAITLQTVEARAITPVIFGIGTVETRFSHKIGPTVAGRLKWLQVQVGDSVSAGQLLGEMDASDMDARIAAQHAAMISAEAHIRQAQAQATFATSQADRYARLLQTRGTSEEMVVSKRMERDVAVAALSAAEADAGRVAAELAALKAQRDTLRLTAPVDGLIVERYADPGTTIVAGQTVVEVIEPSSTWINARFDQVSARGLTADLTATIVLQSRGSETFTGTVKRIEPRADVVTEESLAKIAFDSLPTPLPALGELAEVTVQIATQDPRPVVDNAAIRSFEGRRGVWVLSESGLRFSPVVLGRSTLDGKVQVLEGLLEGERIVLYSEKALSPDTRTHIVEQIPGVNP